MRMRLRFGLRGLFGYISVLCVMLFVAKMISPVVFVFVLGGIGYLCVYVLIETGIKRTYLIIAAAARVLLSRVVVPLGKGKKKKKEN